MIKKVWVSKDGRDMHMLCIRQHPNDLEMVHNKNDFPPTERLGGRLLNIDEAKEKGLVEKHHVLGIFSTEDLLKIRNAIDKVLGDI